MKIREKIFPVLSRFSILANLPLINDYFGDAISIDLEKLNFPGEFPYTRGIHPNMYRGKLWTMRQFSGFGHKQYLLA